MGLAAHLTRFPCAHHNSKTQRIGVEMLTFLGYSLLTITITGGLLVIANAFEE